MHMPVKDLSNTILKQEELTSVFLEALKKKKKDESE